MTESERQQLHTHPHRIVGRLTQTSVYGLDQEFSYPVERDVNGSLPMYVDLAHDVIVWDTSSDKHESRRESGI